MLHTGNIGDSFKTWESREINRVAREFPSYSVSPDSGVQLVEEGEVSGEGKNYLVER